MTDAFAWGCIALAVLLVAAARWVDRTVHDRPDCACCGED